MAWRGIIDEYREFLPVSDKTPVISLKEGQTPLLRAINVEGTASLDLDLYLKFDGANPTGSFKDRGMTMAISKAVEAGSEAVLCASTGNTSASAAAYAARFPTMLDRPTTTTSAPLVSTPNARSIPEYRLACRAGI